MNAPLLPSGLRDLLPPEAAGQYALVARLMERFALFGYDPVIPPLIEFEDTMLPEKGTILDTQTFRFMDPLSGRMLALRSDITTQISRIAATRLATTARPLRLSYTGTVLRVRPEELENHRQHVQAGIELYGSMSASGDAEVIYALLEALQVAGFGEIVVDLCIAGLLDCLLTGEAEAICAATREAVRHKDTGALPASLPCRKLIEQLLALSGPAEEACRRLSGLTLPQAALPLRDSLLAVVDKLPGVAGVTLTVDPLASAGFEYHRGVCFSLFLPQTRQEIGRGGRYDSLSSDGKTVSATGGTLYVTRLLDAFAMPAAGAPVMIGDSPDASRSLRDEGKVTLHRLSD